MLGSRRRYVVLVGLATLVVVGLAARRAVSDDCVHSCPSTEWDAQGCCPAKATPKPKPIQPAASPPKTSKEPPPRPIAPKLDIRGSDTSTTGAQVWVDGEVKGAPPVVIETTAGRHLIEVKRDAYVSFARWVVVKAGDVQQVAVKLVESNTAPQAKSPPAPTASNPAVDEGILAVDIHDDLKNDQILGTLGAPVTIVWAWDFADPYCERALSTIKELLHDYEGKLRVVFKNMIVHPALAMPAHLAGCAAGRQHKFVEFWQAFWTTAWAAYWKTPHDASAIDADHMITMARDLGLDIERFKTDMNGSACDAFIKADMAELSKFVIMGVPTFFINGSRMVGALPKERFAAVIDAKLDLVARSHVSAARYYDTEIRGNGLRAATRLAIHGADDAAVLLDGNPQWAANHAKGPVVVATTPGDHVVEVKRAGFDVFSDRVLAKSGQETVVTVKLVASASASPSAISATCPEGMVRIPAGTFEHRDQRQRDKKERLTVSSYCIDKTEVTVAAWATCVAKHGCPDAPTSATLGYESHFGTDAAKLQSQLCNGNHADRHDHPVNCIDWNLAAAYCKWAGKRLPKGPEWEYAALGSDGRTYPWGNDPPTARRMNACGSECAATRKVLVPGTTEQLMYRDNDGWNATSPVGSYPDGASPFGVLDLAGNVSEWIGGYGPDDPATHGSLYNTRGGDWLSVAASSMLDYVLNSTDARLPHIGFRCARGD